ncbi:multidrug effflux MFS transporter [Streptomyces sp. 147326]|uniref:multidrug effflux MFS transporter n=1 Tax=Streptomyces sp. 147326 TaxID=3074379 RepID=UPI003857AB1D
MDVRAYSRRPVTTSHAHLLRPPKPPAVPRGLLTTTLALLSFVVPLSTDMYLPGFPAMAKELATDAAGVQLTLTAFLVGLAVGQLTFGPLSDRHGRRMPILLGTGVCVLATVLCALAPTLELLIAFRFVAGFTGAAGVVVGRAMVADLATGAVAARIFGILMALGGLAPIVAPLVGGVAVSGSGSWRAAFWVLACATALVLTLAYFTLPESLPTERRQRTGSPASALSGLADRVYLGHTVVFGFASAALFCYIAASPFVLQNVLGFSVGEASAVFAGGALTATVSSAAATRLVVRHSPGLLLRIGLGLLLAPSATALLITFIGQLSRVTALPLVAIGFVGLGQVFATAPALALERVPHAAGASSAILGTFQSVLGASVAPLMGIAGRYTALPLFLGMTGCSLIAVLALMWTGWERGRRGARRYAPPSSIHARQGDSPHEGGTPPDAAPPLTSPPHQ